MTSVQGAAAAFKGYPAGAKATVIPSAFFSEVLPQIEEPSELRVTLYLFYALGRRQGYPRFVTERELRAEGPLMASLGADAEIELVRGLALAAERGSLLRVERDQDGVLEILYTINVPANRKSFEMIEDGRLLLGRPVAKEAEPPSPEKKNIFHLYEVNIGPITPLVAEALKEAEGLYPLEWLEDALREAALHNKRSWRYAAAILQRWATEGRSRETTGRNSDEAFSARAQFRRRFERLTDE